MAQADERSVAMCRILLRLQLRRLREAKGLTAAEVARRFAWSPARMTRLETKDTAVELGDVRLLCDLYEVPRELRDQLEEFALITKTRRDWWETKPFKDVVPPWFSAFLGLESAADGILIYQSEFVPGLFQTPEYALAILRLAQVSDEKLERHAEVRMKRQSILRRRQYAPSVTVVLNEAVLRRPVGGHDVMKRQLDSIVTLTKLRKVSVQVLPFSVGEHPCMHGPFQVLSFKDPNVGDLAYLENRVDAGVLHNPELVAEFQSSFSRLVELALPQEESLELLRGAFSA